MPKCTLGLTDLGQLLQQPTPAAAPTVVSRQEKTAQVRLPARGEGEAMPSHPLRRSKQDTTSAQCVGKAGGDAASVQPPLCQGPEHPPVLPTSRPAAPVRANDGATVARPAPAPAPSDLPPELLTLKINSQPTSRQRLTGMVREAWGDALDPDELHRSAWSWEQTRAYQLLWGRLA